MPLDSSIPLSFRAPPAPDMTQTIGTMMQMRNMGSEIALRQSEQRRVDQQAEAERAIQTQKNRDLADENTIQQAELNPDTAKRIGAGDFSDIQGRIQPASLNRYKLAHRTLLDKQLTNDSNTLKLNNEKHEVIERGLQGLKSLADPAQAVSEYSNLVQRLQEDGAIKSGTFPTAITDVKDIDRLLAHNGLYYGANQLALSQKKTEGDIAHVAAQAGQATAGAGLAAAKTPGAAAESAKQQIQLDAMKSWQQHPELADAHVDSVVDPKKYPDLNATTKAQVRNAISLGDMQHANAVTDVAARLVNERSAETIDAEARGAAAKAWAAIPAEVKKATETEISKARLSPDAFAGIFDPTARRAAENQYDAASKEYLGKVSESRRLKDLIVAAQSGNKAAPAVIPIEELRGFVNRVNSQELKAVSSGSGTGLDRIEGFIKGYTAGEPIPGNVLSDMSSLADLSEKAARRNYEFNLQVIRQKGAKVNPLEPDQILGGGQPGAAKYKTGDTVLYNGTPHRIKEVTADGKLVLEN